MSTGISISSINRIKELAEEKKYAEALEILDTQNLDKSINPQFLRISGEIFRENKRYYDSRRILLKAHQMSPQGNRIIYELIKLYLELGYFTRAQKYYEQYLFYSSPEDTQRDYVEYSMKKALGTDVRELASILIPILERMPEDRWNFEAVLLYDKMNRKDKALDESRYILENFKESSYVQPVIEYIDDKLDIDQYFYVYPKEEQEEDLELFKDLIEQEEKILEADYLRMYPPEARIMVEAEDKDAIDTRPAKEKKSKKKKKKADQIEFEEETQAPVSDVSADVEEKESVQNIIKEAELLMNPEPENGKVSENQEVNSDEERPVISEEEKQIKEEREAALEKLLSKKIDTDKIKESAKQMAKAVKDIDTNKTKNQVKSVAESVMDNVKKATDVLGEAVGTKQTMDFVEPSAISSVEADEDQIVDGIIESVLEPPKKVVGQVVMNEELDALIPDSLEAMSEEEIAEIEARKEEAERLELEALEAALRLEEQKKAKNRQKKDASAELSSDLEIAETDSESSIGNSIRDISFDSEGSYTELKEKFLAERQKEEEQPLDSLGFISVVHSDVDSTMDEEIPDAAGMLHQMIDNKEFYAGEDSTDFESKASYYNHGFEVEDYDFEAYREQDVTDGTMDSTYTVTTETENIPPTVEVIYAQQQVVDFDEMIPEMAESLEVSADEKTVEELVAEEPIVEEVVAEDAEKEGTKELFDKVTVEEVVSGTVEEAETAQKTETFAEEPEGIQESEAFAEEPEEIQEPEAFAEEPEEIQEPEAFAEEPEEIQEPEALTEEPEEIQEPEALTEEPEEIQEPEAFAEEPEEIQEPEVLVKEPEENQGPEMQESEAESLIEEPAESERQKQVSRRDELRVKIVLTDSMVSMLMDLKGSR